MSYNKLSIYQVNVFTLCNTDFATVSENSPSLIFKEQKNLGKKIFYIILMMTQKLIFRGKRVHFSPLNMPFSVRKI
jgi:hypothetical protein